MKIILDVDPGIDDAMAIALALKTKGVELLGLTTVAGNLPLDKTTDNAAKILKLLAAKCQVYPGMAEPLVRKLHTAEQIHGPTGLGYLDLPKAHEYIEEMHAVDFIVDEINKNPHEVTLIAVGPLTNVAQAIKKDKTIVDKVKEIVVMGGAIFTAGNVTPAAEFNMYVDPESADIVFNSGAKVTLVGLDVTLQVLLTQEHIDILKSQGGKLGTAVGSMTDYYLERYKDHNKLKGCALHDPLAVGVALDRTLVKTQHIYVAVETKGEFTSGQTVGDVYNRYGKQPNIHVCTEIDNERFIKTFMETLLS